MYRLKKVSIQVKYSEPWRMSEKVKEPTIWYRKIRREHFNEPILEFRGRGINPYMSIKLNQV